MITATGYSKDPTLIPEGIAITFSQKMFEDNKGEKHFMRCFLMHLANENNTWVHFNKNKPKYENLNYVYIIIGNKLAYRCMFGGFKIADGSSVVKPGGCEVRLPNSIVLAGPVEKCPFDRDLKGFQGFRYTTKLF